METTESQSRKYWSPNKPDKRPEPLARCVNAAIARDFTRVTDMSNSITQQHLHRDVLY